MQLGTGIFKYPPSGGGHHIRDVITSIVCAARNPDRYEISLGDLCTVDTYPRPLIIYIAKVETHYGNDDDNMAMVVARMLQS